MPSIVPGPLGTEIDCALTPVLFSPVGRDLTVTAEGAWETLGFCSWSLGRDGGSGGSGLASGVASGSRSEGVSVAGCLGASLGLEGGSSRVSGSAGGGWSSAHAPRGNSSRQKVAMRSTKACARVALRLPWSWFMGRISMPSVH
jgi:hypothetical protein